MCFTSADLSELRSCYDDIIKNMPDNYLETVQLLERELCDTHISSLFGCSHFTAANQIILECLMEWVNCKADILDLCESLSLLKNAAKLTSVVDNLRIGEWTFIYANKIIYLAGLHSGKLIFCLLTRRKLNQPLKPLTS